MTVYLRDPDVTILHGDALEQLATLPDGSVDCCVTSPPYSDADAVETLSRWGGDAEWAR